MLEQTNCKYGRYMMSFIDNDVFKDNNNAIANIGDNIQGLVIDLIYRQLKISEKDIVYIKRDFAQEYDGEEAKIVFCSEFSKDNVDKRLNLSNKINIKAIASAVFYDDIKTLSEKYPKIYNILKKHEPIGCRDEKTTEYLRSEGIKAYLMGCFTILLPKRDKTPNKKKCFLVDIPVELEKYIPNEIRKYSEYLSHEVKFSKYPIDDNENKAMDEIAKRILERYKNEATLIVTGRLHVAVPCLAMGIPVILACNNLDFRFGWIEKFIRPYQLGEYEKINWKPNSVDMEEVKTVMLRYFDQVLHNNSGKNELIWLDNYYRNRNKVKPYKIFREKIMDIFHGEPDKKFNYVIWGAGYHCRYAYEIISDIYPNANLVAVVDKYKIGNFKKRPIIRSENLFNIDFDHLFITTVPGTEEAISWIEKFKPIINYTLITSQHKS
mgnify:CR=1 FL=1